MTRAAVYGLLVLVGLVGAAGDAALNHWATTNRYLWLFISYGVLIAAVSLFGVVLKYQQFTFGAAIVLASLIHTGAAMVIDRVFFGGKLSAWEWVGVACAAAIAFMEIGRSSAKQREFSISIPEAKAGGL